MIVKSLLKNTIRISNNLVIVPGINAMKDEHCDELERNLAFYVEKGLVSIEDKPHTEKREVMGGRSDPSPSDSESDLTEEPKPKKKKSKRS